MSPLATAALGTSETGWGTAMSCDTLPPLPPQPTPLPSPLPLPTPLPLNAPLPAGLGAATAPVTLGLGTLRWSDVVAVARNGARVEIAAEGRARAVASYGLATTVRPSRPVYGRTTGVGANRSIEVGAEDADGHGLRLLRSHAGGAGQRVEPEAVRAMLAVRLNQLTAGGSGVRPAVLDAMAEAINRHLLPPVRRIGAIGTADLTALASTALCLIGEQPWEGGELAPVALATSDALAFLSSSAATMGAAALAGHDIDEMLRAALVVAGLSFVAVDGCEEAYQAAVHDARPHPGQRAVAGRMRALLDGACDRPAARVQDPYGLRALPQVHGPAVDAVAHLDHVLTVEMNSPNENPLILGDEPDVYHNGNFHTAYLTHALDGVRTAVFATAGLATSRLATLLEPGYTGLRPFLADGPAGSSGALILEYVAHSALADLRHAAAPSALGSAVLSRGSEDHASFSSQSARRTAELLDSYRTVLACELVAAVRALRLRGIEPAAGPLRTAYQKAATALDERTADRPLDADLASAELLLPELATL
jgi:histidine ammonia-lyase